MYTAILHLSKNTTVPCSLCIVGELFKFAHASFYYDEMVRDYLPRINPETEAKTFLETMNKGIPEYNCFANAAKTNTNFKVNEDGSLTLDEHKDWMAWCGVLINTTNLEVRSDYTRYASKKIRDHLSIITHPRPLLNLHQLMRRAVVLKCQPIFLDCQVQSEKTVLCNVYQVFLLLAVKTHTALRTLQLRGLRLRKYTKFLHCLILQSARYFHSRARAKCREVGTTLYGELNCRKYFERRISQRMLPHPSQSHLNSAPGSVAMPTGECSRARTPEATNSLSRYSLRKPALSPTLW
ncbi:Telomerase reverse transcriptase [Geodia barretti]|uniref:Telomerase reverse transcriptase n=1 Tax=Geodia barretti TaxID=519541 RepID=A0AA35W4K4_GEOBA|nr:Telomerase reverse transcriptase [Geodia barretti]